QYLNAAIWDPVADLPDTLSEDEGATVSKVVPVYGGNDAITESQAFHSPCKPCWFFQIQPHWLPGGNGAIAASPRTDIAQDHERGAAALPALAYVGAVGLFTDGVEFGSAQEVAHLVVDGPPGHGHLDPFWVASLYCQRAAPQAGWRRSIIAQGGRFAVPELVSIWAYALTVFPAKAGTQDHPTIKRTS
ncbi:MAG: hypothetical protein C1O27_002276, partial [Chloroflexi bacterium]